MSGINVPQNSKGSSPVDCLRDALHDQSMINSKFSHRIVALLIASVITICAAGTAAAATDLDPNLPDMPRIRGGAISVGSGDERVVCVGSANSHALTCQTMGSGWGKKNKRYNTVTFDFEERSGSKRSANMDLRNTKITTLKKGEEYEYDGVIVQRIGDRLYFNSPVDRTVGRVSESGWKIQEFK